MSRTRQSDRQIASEWAATMLKREDALILDTETSDLNGEILELSIINLKGDVLYNGRFKPSTPIHWKAAQIHGLTAEILAHEPTWTNEYPAIREILTGKLVLIYNAAFDVPMLRSTCKRYGCEPIAFGYDCVMEQYAAYVGDWNSYYQSYTWQKLPAGDHSAYGDTLATLTILKKMAGVL